MSNEQQLKDEVAKAERAQRAYDSYLKDFFAEQDKLVYDSFLASDSVETLQLVQYTLKALQELKTSVSQDIYTGKLAQQQLNLEK